MSKGTNKCQQLNTNGNSAITVGFLIDHKAYLTSSKIKSYLQIQSRKQHFLNPTWHHPMPNGRARTHKKAVLIIQRKDERRVGSKLVANYQRGKHLRTT